MQKIVVNKCFGGFGLSDEAFELYLKKKGVKKFYKEKSWMSSNYYLVPPEKYKRLSEKWWKEDGDYGRINAKDWFLSDRDIERDDPLLVEVVKELGKKANGACAELKIVKIPDGVEWEIDEYDGLETIDEKHSSWS